MSRLLIWLGVGCAAALVLSALAPPLLHAVDRHGAAAAIHLALGPACHQDPPRSFALGGRPMALCARCLGIYAGFLAAAIGIARGLGRAGAERVVRFPPRWLLAAAAAPMALQWGLARLPIPWAGPDGNLPRALTGAILGAALAAFVLPAVHEMAGELRRLRRSPAPQERHDAPTA